MVSASAFRHLSGKVQPVTGCSKGKKGEEKKCTGLLAGNGFLNTRFLPVRENKYPLLKNRRMIEKEFFNSLSNLQFGKAAAHRAFIGWILTALAISLGAPFWFDLLSKFTMLRGANAKTAGLKDNNIKNSNNNVPPQNRVG